MLKKFILEELQKSSFRLEENIPQAESDFNKWLSAQSKSEINDINNKVIQILTKNFSGGFAKFLYNHLNKTSKKNKDLIIRILFNYISNPNKTSADNLFELLGMPILIFFIKKTFGKESIWSKIRQITPFMKKISTGNAQLDIAIYDGLNKALADPKVRNGFKKDIYNDFINPTIDSLKNDSDFVDLFDDNQVNEVLGIQNRIDRIKAAFSSPEFRSKFNLVRDTLKYLPYVKSELKNRIKRGLLNASYEDIVGLFDRKKGVDLSKNLGKISKHVTIEILSYIVEKSQDIYFEEFSNSKLTGSFMDLVKDVLVSKPVVDNVSISVYNFLKEGIDNAVLAQKKKEQKKFKSKYK